MRWRCSRRRASSGSDVGGDGDQVLPRHQLVDAQAGVGGEAHVAVGEDADQPAGVALHHRDAADVVAAPSARCASASVWSGWMVSGFTTMPDSNFFTWRTWAACSSGVEVLVDHADAAELGHGDRHVALGDGVHRRGDQRDVAGAISRVSRVRGVGRGGQDLGIAGHQQHVVEGQAPPRCGGSVGMGGCRMPWPGAPFRTLAAPLRAKRGAAQAQRNEPGPAEASHAQGRYRRLGAAVRTASIGRP